jgi:hypothetical protein
MAIMYVCDGCCENNPEACGRFDRNELRVVDGGKWVCESCFDDVALEDFAALGGGDYKPLWSYFPPPPEYVAARLAVPQ